MTKGIATSRGILLTACLSLITLAAWGNDTNVYKLTLNGLDIGVDSQTGDVVYLSYPATGIILEAPREKSGLLDLAYPYATFTPMRLASRFSRAQIIKEANGVTISWDALGPSRGNFKLPAGKVSAQVTFRAAEDGRSIIIDCKIQNHSELAVPQILFPDFWGLQPVDGPEGTRLRLARGVERPFSEPVKKPDSAPFYADLGWKTYHASGGYYAENAMRWFDFGGLNGGLSMFQKKWGTEDRPDIRTFRSELNPMSMRLAWEHKHTVAPGESWDSGEFWLTPHPGGWAKGIEVYRQYVKQVNPGRPLPNHVRDGLGFQTVFIAQDQEMDPAKTDFQFVDLPRIASDAATYGIDEVVFWHAAPAFILPIPLYPEVGTIQEMIDGIHQGKKSGVNMAPFFSVHETLNRTAAEYGVKPSEQNWTFHSELIPNFQPYYVKGFESVWVPSDNALWQKRVLDCFTDWVKKGVYSFSWDEFGGNDIDARKSGLINTIEKVRTLARAQDPESTFSGESIDADSLEHDGKVLDFTWNWVDYVDAGPILNVLHEPRLNCNVEDSAKIVKKGFIDGLYLNVMPKKPDGENGSALISSQPEMAEAVRTTASLRKQFLPFFVDGTFIGDSVLRTESSGFVHGYALEKRLLVMVLNDRDKPQFVTVGSDLGLWLPTAPSYLIKYYDSTGKLVRTTRSLGKGWTGTTDNLAPNGLAMFEIDAE